MDDEKTTEKKVKKSLDDSLPENPEELGDFEVTVKSDEPPVDETPVDDEVPADDKDKEDKVKEENILKREGKMIDVIKKALTDFAEFLAEHKIPGYEDFKLPVKKSEEMSAVDIAELAKKDIPIIKKVMSELIGIFTEHGFSVEKRLMVDIDTSKVSKKLSELETQLTGITKSLAEAQEVAQEQKISDLAKTIGEIKTHIETKIPIRKATVNNEDRSTLEVDGKTEPVNKLLESEDYKGADGVAKIEMLLEQDK